jgi:hypothetical protein
MPRITRDPTKDKCPIYEDEDYMTVREMIIAGHQGPGHLSNEEAVGKLKEAWQNAQDRKVALWNEQTREEEERVHQQTLILLCETQ